MADLLNPMHAVRYGGGIQRILAACENASLPTPELENFQGGFRIVFKQVATPQVTPQVEQLLHVLQSESTRQGYAPPG